MKPPRDFEAAVRSAGFTPALREADAVVALLGHEDETVAKGAERALAQLGENLLPIALRHAPEAPPRVRARLCLVMGRIAPLPDEAMKYLIFSLHDADPKTRRNAAIALGKAQGHGPEAALVAAWDRETDVAHRRTLAASLGKVGSHDALGRLRALITDDPELERIAAQSVLMLTRTLTRPSASAIDGTRAPASPVAILFRCRAGLEPLLVDELGEAWRPQIVGKGAVRATLKGQLETAFAARTALTFAFPLAPQEIVPPEDSADAVIRALASDEARTVFQNWTEGQVRYRIDWAEGGHRRAAVWRIAKRVAELVPGVVNDPTSSTWEAVVREPGKHLDGAERRAHVDIELVPRKLVDPRFLYRGRDVPAASHPTLAAALVRIAGARTDDVVWDPFVGSATELIERARFGAYAELHGTDLDPAALGAARANLAAASVDASLTEADACATSPRGVTLILTNPPMGRRLLRDADLGKLLERFIAHAASSLVPGGRLVWISPMGERAREWARAARLELELSHDVDMGGFFAEIQVMRKPSRG